MKQGWEIKKLGAVAEYFNGLTYSPKDVSDIGTIVLRSSNIQNDELDFSDIVRVNVDIKEKLFLKEGDILMCSRNGSQRLVGKTAPILNLPEPMTFGTFMMIIRSEFSPYLLWFFKTDEFKKQISGGENTMINQVTRYMLDEIKIPLPPLPEQQRIVSILDEAFAAIAKSKAIAEQNLQNAKELFESYLQGVFEKKGDGWEEKKLGEVTNIQRGSSPRPKGDPRYFSARETEFNWITISDISSFCEDNVLLRTREWLTEEGSKQSRFVDENEFIIAVSGSTTGKCCITGIKGFIYDGLAVVKVKKNILDPIFLLNYMMSLYSTINNSKAGAAFPNINTNYLNNLPISFPPLQAQQTIVRQLDALRAEAQKLEAVYQKKIDDLEELKKSILQKAFAGELRSPEGAEYKSEVATPLADKKPNTITSPEGV